MAAICGVGSLFCCPWCLVAQGDLWNLSIHSTARTSDTMRAILEAANQAKLAGEKEELLKSFGLQDIEVFLL